MVSAGDGHCCGKSRVTVTAQSGVWRGLWQEMPAQASGQQAALGRPRAGMSSKAAEPGIHLFHLFLTLMRQLNVPCCLIPHVLGILHFLPAGNARARWFSVLPPSAQL